MSFASCPLSLHILPLQPHIKPHLPEHLRRHQIRPILSLHRRRRREAVEDGVDVRAFIDEARPVEFAAEHEGDPFAEFALFEAVLVGDVEGFVEDPVALDPVYAVDRRVAGIFFIFVADIGDQVKVVFRLHDADGFYGGLADIAVRLFVFHPDLSMGVDGGAEFPDLIDEASAVARLYVVEEFITDEIRYFSSLHRRKAGFDQVIDDIFHFCFI